MFHDILPEAVEGFKANLQFLKRNTNVVSLDDFLAGRLTSGKVNIVITFDDGYKSWITTAIPFLKELRLPATFFVSSGFVGLRKEDEADYIRSKLLIKRPIQRTTAGLSLEDLRRIVEEGFCVGGHTLNHSNLGELRNIAQIKYEIAEDKQRLERITGRKIDYFAYPFGGYHNPSTNLIEVLKECGYRGAVTTVSGFNGVGYNAFLLHRELTFASMPERMFRARAYGNYDAIQFLKRFAQVFLQR